MKGPRSESQFAERAPAGPVPVLVLVVLVFAAPVPAQTSGFIYARPACVPPTTVGAVQVRDTVNYLQGPKPILLAPGGEIAILTNAGQCCFANNWEGIFTLRYPTNDRPLFYPIWGSNNFGNEPSRGENNTAGFPSAILQGTQWRLGYSAGFQCNPGADPLCTSDNYVRLGRIDIPNLTTQALASQVANAWIGPENPNCQLLGSCGDVVAGIMPSLILHPNGQLYAYHSDTSVPGCASRWTRHLVNSDMSIPHPAGDGCLIFNPAPTDPVFLDIARASDGSLYALSDGMPGSGQIVEWRSVDESPTYPLGTMWRLTGTVRNAPPGPVPGFPTDSYSVWDPAYLTDSTGLMVQPKVIVAQISHSGPDEPPYSQIKNPFGYLVDASQGNWFLYYWADAGAYLPSGFGSFPPLATPPPLFPAGDTLWFDDQLPAGAQTDNIVGNPALEVQFIWDHVQVASGVQGHTHNGSSGIRQHYFYNATGTLALQAGDRLVNRNS